MIRKPAFRILRELRNGARRDVPNLLGSDCTYIHADSADAAIRQAKAYGHSGRLVAVSESN